ncbi:hypothetical protein JXL21_12305 [Candidatus Bathyarchaeota archaeon]|nr:hypothetical protein [Candidatus Bathyarchaeota archaeon]
MKSSQLLGIFIALVQIGGVLGFTAGMHAMIGVFSTVIPGEGEQIDLEMTDPVIIHMSLTPRNDGYLKATLYVTLSLVAEGDHVLASDYAEVTLMPGEQAPVDLELSIPLSTAMQYLQDGSDVEWVTSVEVSSLYDLISFSNTVTMSGGGD